MDSFSAGMFFSILCRMRVTEKGSQTCLIILQKEL
ncbi:Uncharacterized protein TCM_019960 isoform 2 [Theobroma cacao]|uniref:Uncharacterized protein isoform 2 n=1 Tax=Theobroma cacao TaxID=3641 RepID=A0A061EK67_THECC|nr:Uncharacterized protein TCM_019960 isoform 2 [Theobroma cacao]